MPEHLTKQYNTWTFQRRVPNELREHPLFKGKTTIRKSLKTDSLTTALKLRDQENARLESLIKGDFITNYDLAYEELIKHEGNPIALDPEREEALQSHMDAHMEAHRIGDTLDKAYKKDPELMAIMSYYQRAIGQEQSAVKATLIQALELTKDKAKQDGHAQRYINSFDNVVSKFLDYLGIEDIELSKIDTVTVDEYIQHRLKEVTTKTVKNDITTLSTIFKTTKRKRMVTTDNPFLEPDLSTKPNTPREAFNVSEAKAVLEALPEQYKLPWMIAYYTGIRRAELFKLDASSIVVRESEKGLIKCLSIAPDGTGKTENATRLIPIHPELEPYLKDFKGFDFSANTFGKYRLRVTKELFGEDFAERHPLHSLRHTFSTTLHNHFPEKPQLVDWLTGHTRSIRSESFQSYFHGYGLDQLYDAVEAIPSL